MPEHNPHDSNPSENFTTGNASQSLDANAAYDMVVYEPQQEPNDVPPQAAAENTPQFIPQDMPENVQMNDQSRPGKGKFRERLSQEQVYGNDVPLGDEIGRQTGSRVHFEENSSTGRSRDKESGRMGSHGGGSHRGESHKSESHRGEPRRTDDRDKKSHNKDSHRSGSDRKDSHRSESRRSDPSKRDSQKSSKKGDFHKKKTKDATPEYGRISFRKTVTHYVQQTPYVRNPVETKKRGN
ncbi:hypothetical protein H9Q70_012244 [Fusarium xylarioides]|nr:hypothetical protein H9Q70_012244 [Fusarium xylarioides]KAG5774684.1 hypothetical protein H9Q73_011641 [Fusarium xylarioides]